MELLAHSHQSRSDGDIPHWIPFGKVMPLRNRGNRRELGQLDVCSRFGLFIQRSLGAPRQGFWVSPFSRQRVNRTRLIIST